jgi:hypothetical protein
MKKFKKNKKGKDKDKKGEDKVETLTLTRFRKTRICKILSVILLGAFISSSPGFAAADLRENHARKGEPITQTLPKDILVPRNIGTVKETHLGDNGKLVIHIQDAHCNYEAQSNIARILEHIIRKYKVNLVAVEGADGVVNTEWFKAFPDSEIRRDVADYFMKKGELTGTEFLSITKDYPFTIYGAEDRKTYQKNLIAFLESYPYKEEFKKFYANVKSALGRLKKFIYTKELSELDKKVIQHEEEKIKFSEYVKYLNELSGSKGIDLKEYKNITLLVKSLRYEKDIDFKTVNRERAKLIDELGRKLSKDALSKLVASASEFKQGKIGTEVFHSYLVNLAKENGIPIAGEYKNLTNYIVYSHIYSGIDNEKLFDELELLVGAIKEKMFANENQRVLDRLWTNVNIVLGFAEISLTNKRYEYYLAHRNEFTPEGFAEFIRKKSDNYGLTYNIDIPQNLESIFSKLVNFYELGLKRDRILVKNMFNGMRGKKTDIAVLVSGGFHTKGISKRLKEKGASYVVVSPAITKDTESPYISVLTGQKTPFEELFVEGSTTSQLTPPWFLDADILRGAERMGMSAEARELLRGVLAERRENLEEYARMFMHAHILTSPELIMEHARPAHTAMLARFDELCASAKNDAKVVKLREILKSEKGGEGFAAFVIIRNNHRPADLRSSIPEHLRDITDAEPRFAVVRNHLLRCAPLMVLALETLRDLIGNEDTGEINTRIAALTEDTDARAVLAMAFEGPAQGGGGAVTIDGRALSKEKEKAVDDTIKNSFKPMRAIGEFIEGQGRFLDINQDFTVNLKYLVSKVCMEDDKLDEIFMDEREGLGWLNRVGFVESTGLDQHPYVFAHSGRGGQTYGHKLLRIYMGPSDTKQLKGFQQPTKEQFFLHELVHLRVPRREGQDVNEYEAEIQKIAPIDKVLAEIAAAEVIDELRLGTKYPSKTIRDAAFGVASYLEGEFRSGRRSLEAYTRSLSRCVNNIAHTLTSTSVAAGVQSNLRIAIRSGQWSYIVKVYGAVPPSSGPAVTVDASELAEDEKTEVDAAIAGDYAAGRIKVLDNFQSAFDLDPAKLGFELTVNGIPVKFKEAPSLEPFGYVIGHPGRGGAARNHPDRHTHFSPSMRKWIHDLPREPKIAFFRHEVKGHLEHPDWSEEEVQRRIPGFDLVLAQVERDEKMTTEAMRRRIQRMQDQGREAIPLVTVEKEEEAEEQRSRVELVDVDVQKGNAIGRLTFYIDATRVTAEEIKVLTADSNDQPQPYRLYVEKGSVAVEPRDAGDRKIVNAGESLSIMAPVDLEEAGDFSDEGTITAYIEVPATQATRIGYEALRAMRHTIDTAAEETAGPLVMLHEPQGLHRGNGYAEERRLIKKATAGKVEIKQYDSFVNFAQKGLNLRYRHVFVVYGSALEEARALNNPKLNRILKRERVISVKAPDVLGEKHAFADEIVEAGIALGRTTADDISEGAGSAGYLRNIMSALIGSEVEFNDLTRLLTADSRAPNPIVDRLNHLNNGLCIPHARPVTGREQERIRAIRKVKRAM